ncbi:MAG: kynureninase [Proteobacteria bacterium]|nr:kynureninase [Pseudomonadota bacterium]
MTAFTLADAKARDAADKLAPLRQAFHKPKQADGSDVLYFGGNSLGLMPKKARDYMTEELDDWATMGVTGYFASRNNWVRYHEQFKEPLARLVGALPHEVAAMLTLTANLHLAMVSFYRPTPSRYKIVIEKQAFPSDHYAIRSQLAFHGFGTSDALIELAPREGEDTLRMEDVEHVLEVEGANVALVLLSGLAYYSGQRFDLKKIAAMAHAHGCAVGFDLAHAVGNVPLNLHDADADFAVWCHYKYVNAGPGAVGGLFVHERHHAHKGLPRLEGWWGNNLDTRFKMGPEFDPAPGVDAWQLSNYSVFSFAALRASLELFEKAGMGALREKSVALTTCLYDLLAPLDGVEVFTSADPEQRGAQLSVRVAGGRKTFEALQAHGVVCDWREPDCIRLAPAPLYTSFEEVYRLTDVLRQVITQQLARVV